jgi:flagellar biosynthetic protein FliR
VSSFGALSHLLGQVNFTLILLQLALVMGRVLPMALLAPFLGGDLVQSEVKLGVGITLSLILYPLVGAGQPVPLFAFPFMALLIKEVALGGVLAFMASMIFEAARAAGTFIDTMSGANQATVMVPQIQQQASLFADLQFQFAVVLFLAMRGHHVVITALADSFDLIPINGYPHFVHGTWPFFELVLQTTGHLMVVCVALSAPAAAASFLSDVALGLVNRVAPQIQVFFMSMSIKPVMTVLVMLLAVHVFSDELAHQFGLMLDDVKRTAMLMH